jgi:hypothetical protein
MQRTPGRIGWGVSMLVVMLVVLLVRSGVGTLTVVRGLLLASAALAAGLAHGVPPE